MSEKFIIKGRRPLSGEVSIRGYKNAAGAALAATLLTSEECIIDNLPLVEDVSNMIETLKSLGVTIEWLGKRKIRINPREISLKKVDYEKISKTRISVLLIGALLPRVKSFKISHPGGDRIGLRPISTHIKALEKMGAKVIEKGDFYYFNIKEPKSSNIVLKEFSVTATENLLMAASLSQKTIVIKGAASEPQVQDLGQMLKSMGAQIKGLGTSVIRVDGVSKLRGTYHKIIPDPLEAGTFIAMAAVTPGKVVIKNIIPSHLDLFLDKIEEIGVKFKLYDSSIAVEHSTNLKPTKVQAFPFPGYPTDLIPIILPLLTQAKGKSLIHDPLYENRFGYAQELRKMGADIEIVDPHRAFVFGKTPLHGLKIESWDIRGGASLIIAGLMAKGKTTIENIFQIDRGYERIEERLQKLGADIKRVKT